MIPADLLAIATEIAPNGPAVYFLIVGDEVVYVGGSARPAGRIKRHRWLGRQFDRALCVSVTAEILPSIETVWIRRLAPRHNKRDNPRPDPAALSWGDSFGGSKPGCHTDGDPMLFAVARFGGTRAVLEYRKTHPRVPPRRDPGFIHEIDRAIDEFQRKVKV